MTVSTRVVLLTFFAVAALAGCNALLGNDSHPLSSPDGGGNGGPKSDGGLDGDAAGVGACKDGELRFCSASGAKGNCAKGAEACKDGKWGTCSIVPMGPDSCVTKGDDSDCNGMPNEACPCISGDTQPCGPPAAVGRCVPGTATCANGVWGACAGAVEKAARDCTSTADNDCDGQPDNTPDATCACVAYTTELCDVHPGNDGKGPCHAGSHSCVLSADKTKASWGACQGAVGPAGADTCTQDNDANCNGKVNEGCQCIVGKTTQKCGSCNGVQVCTEGKAGVYGACSVSTPGNFGTVCWAALPGACKTAGTIDCGGNCTAVAGSPDNSFHTTKAPNDSWDWNCDGKDELGLTTVYSTCTYRYVTIGVESCSGAGWANSVPSCGDPGTLYPCSLGACGAYSQGALQSCR